MQLPAVLYSLFERWKKACWVKQQSIDNGLGDGLADYSNERCQPDRTPTPERVHLNHHDGDDDVRRGGGERDARGRHTMNADVRNESLLIRGRRCHAAYHHRSRRRLAIQSVATGINETFSCQYIENARQGKGDEVPAIDNVTKLPDDDRRDLFTIIASERGNVSPLNVEKNF